MQLQCSLSQSTSLSHELKMLLRQVLAQRLELRHPDIPEAKRGLEGMLVADALLKERHASGLLIGGLADAIWNQRRTEEELLEHHDTDVLVLSEDFVLEEKFERGIDWWLPTSALLVMKELYGNVEGKVHWWQNGNGICLRYGIGHYGEAKPGLYLPHRLDVISMRAAEIMAGIDVNRVELSGDFEDELYRRIEKKMGTQTPSFLRKAFPQTLMDPSLDIHMVSFSVEPFSIQKVTAIHSYTQNEE